ncbi:MAG: GNAT family N-acetyltransferase [Pseudomonadota bacterium]
MPDNLRIEQVDARAEPVLHNLVNHYLYDMAEWFEFDSEPDATYTFDLEPFWRTDHAVYLAYVGELPVGFALLAPGERFIGKPGWDLEEFFVLRRYRRSHIGHELAAYVWRAHPGEWIVRVFLGNRTALPFWHRCIKTFAGGRYQQERVVRYERHWDHLRFSSPAQ